jgi:hypothetical protein
MSLDSSRILLVYFPNFVKMEIGLCDHLDVCVYEFPTTINFWTPKAVYMRLSMCMILREPVSTASS